MPSRNPITRLLPRRRRVQPGAPPGTLTAHEGALETRVRLVLYDADELVELEPDPGEIASYRNRDRMVWVDVAGLRDVALVESIGAAFDLHPLALEDVLNGQQRAKTELFERHCFTIARAPGGDGVPDQLSIFFGHGFVVTFRDSHDARFEPILTRLRAGRRNIRTGGGDYLAYALLDAAVDSYFPVLETFGEQLETIEERILEDVDRVEIGAVQAVKRKLSALRRDIWPHREAVNALLRPDAEFVEERTRLYLRDCYDHTVQIMDLVEIYRDQASGLADLYLSSVSERMNEVMKLLTIIATVFIPLGFIAGLYGMNFDPGRSPWNMPELSWYWGYPFALGLMTVVALGLVVYFRRKGWLGGRR